MTSCWLWTGCVTADYKKRAGSVPKGGYGQLSVGGKQRYAHRLAYEWLRGPIPAGLHIDHLCRVRRCVNPWHLEAVTNRENWLRGEHSDAKTYLTGICQRGHKIEGENEIVKKRDADGNVLHHQCRTCANESCRKHYPLLKDAQRQRRKEANLRYRQRLKAKRQRTLGLS